MNRKSSVLIMGGAIAVAVMGGITFAMLQPGEKNSAPTSTQPSVVAFSPAPSTPVSSSQQALPPASPVDTISANPAPPPASPKPAVREVKSCVVQMATVNDPSPPLNVRSNPTTSSNVVGQVDNGTFLTVAEERDGWFRITYPYISRCA